MKTRCTHIPLPCYAALDIGSDTLMPVEHYARHMNMVRFRTCLYFSMLYTIQCNLHIGR